MDNTKVNRYRKNTHRCRTCMFAENKQYGGWICKAKNKEHLGGVEEMIIGGCLCKLYEARELSMYGR